jgi:hypothetical protein
LNVRLILASLILFAVYVLKFPDLLLGGEPFLESGTNFFFNAYKLGFWENLVTTDTGYLVLLPRLIAYVSVRVLHLIEWYPYAAQGAAGFFISLYCGLLNVNALRPIIDSDVSRFLVSLFFGSALFLSGIWIGEFNYFHNFAYSGLVPVACFLFADLPALGTCTYWLVIALLTLTVASKASFVVFGPAYGVLALYSIYRKDRRAGIFYLLPLLGICTQVISLALNVKAAGSIQLTPLAIACRTVELYLATYANALLDLQWIRTVPEAVVLSATALFLTGCFLLLLVHEDTRKWHVLGFLAAVNLAGFLSVALSISSIAVLIDATPSIPNVRHTRHFIFVFFAAYASMLVLLCYLPKSRRIQALAVTAALTLFLTTGNIENFTVITERRNPDEGFSHWKSYVHLIKNDEFFIPVQPFPWAIQSGLSFLNDPNIPSFPADVPTDAISVANREWMVSGAILVNDNFNDHLDPRRRLRRIIATDPKGQVQVAKELSRPAWKYRYFLFNRPISVARLEFASGRDHPISILPTLKLVGRHTS